MEGTHLSNSWLTNFKFVGWRIKMKISYFKKRSMYSKTSQFSDADENQGDQAIGLYSKTKRE